MKQRHGFTKFVVLLALLAMVFSLSIYGATKTAFNWKSAKGATIKLMLVQHSIAEAMVKKIPEFEKLTGIKVEYSITPEENYFDKVTTSLNSRAGDMDIFMSGAYQLWDYAPAGFVEDLGPYLNNPKMTSANYDIADIYAGAIGAMKWDLVPGHKAGTGMQLGLPMAFEIYSLAYNKRLFKEKGIKPPKTMDELLAVCEKLKEWGGKGTYPLAIRGARNWGTIHPAYMSTYENYGAKDFKIQNGKLVSLVNSPESVAMNEMWVKLIKVGGSPSWSSYTWYQAGADLGAGRAAMLWDADNNGIQQNWPGASKEAGNIAWVPQPLPAGATKNNSNLWTWGIAMNKASKNKVAAWLAMQYFTSKSYLLYASTVGNAVDPVRASVWDSAAFKKKIGQHEGYSATFQATINNTRILFTPQPHFQETTTEWAATLQDLVAGKYKTIQEGLDDLKKKTDEAVSDVEIKK